MFSKSNSPLANNEDVCASNPYASMRKIMDNSSYFSTLWNENFEIVDCNEKCTEFFGAQKSEILNDFFSFSPPFQPDEQISVHIAKVYLKKCMDEGFFTFDWTFAKKDGTLFSAKIALVRHFINDKPCAVSYTFDVVYPENTNVSSVNAYEKMQTVLRHLPEGVDFWSKDFELLDCSDATLRMFNLKNKREYLENFRSLSPEFQPDGQRTADLIPQYLGEVFSVGYKRFEWMHVTLDGEELPVEIIGYRVKSAGEDVAILYYKDMRKIKQGIQEIEWAEEKFKLLLDFAPYSITMWDSNYNPVDCNLATLKFFGFEDKEDYFNNYYKVLPTYRKNKAGRGEPFEMLFKQTFKDGFAYYEGEIGHYTSDEIFFVEAFLRKTVIRGQEYAVGYLSDLTYQKAMLNEIVESHRVISLARDEAEKSTRIKGEFLANMSHEIRTPMNGILGLIHLLSFTNLEKQQKNYVEKIRHSAESLLRIINDILDFSKIEAGKLEIENTCFSLKEIQEDLLALFSAKFDEKNIQGSIFQDKDLSTRLIGDPLRLKQVLLNLMSNAIKFTEQGSVMADVMIDICEEDSRVNCTFCVSDTGIGLSEENVAKLFKAFSQADASTTRKYGGTGLGLVISKRIVEIMQGDIWVESEIGKGSKFYFTAVFELDTSEPEDINLINELELSYDIVDEESSQPAPLINNKAHTFGYILLVEDNEINQLIAQELLLAKGHKVDIANNGQEAIEMLNANTYDLVLMDIQMPVMDGLTASAKIREDVKFTDLPIIAMSAHAMKGDKEISLQHGMNDHLIKPIDPDDLYASLNYWLGKKHSSLCIC